MTLVEPVTMPGVYDMPAEQYHRDPVPGGSLSSSGARKLLPPSCPALYRYWADREQASKAAFDFGHAAHLAVLGAGPEVEVIHADDWRTKAAREARDAAYTAGKVPVLAAEYQHVQAMAAALYQHPIASVLFDPDYGQPEQSLFWIDGPSGIWRRARLDWLPEHHGGRLIIADYKTTRCAAPTHLGRAVYDHGYHQQAAWYLDGIPVLGLAAEAAFLFVAQEKTPPYLVTVIELDALALRIGRDLNRQAIDVYAECAATGVWPGYTTDIELVGLPTWAETRHLEDYR